MKRRFESENRETTVVQVTYFMERAARRRTSDTESMGSLDSGIFFLNWLNRYFGVQP